MTETPDTSGSGESQHAISPGLLRPCAEVVEELTDYTEDALEPGPRHRVDEHLGDCEECSRVLGQLRAVADLAGTFGRTAGPIVDAGLAADRRAALLDAFDRHRRRDS